MFHPISKPRRELKLRRAASIFDELRGIWKCDESLSRVFVNFSSAENHWTTAQTTGNINKWTAMEQMGSFLIVDYFLYFLFQSVIEVLTAFSFALLLLLYKKKMYKIERTGSKSASVVTSVFSYNGFSGFSLHGWWTIYFHSLFSRMLHSYFYFFLLS